MSPHGRELLVARVVSGSLRLKARNHREDAVTVCARQPTREQRYLAQEVYQEALVEAEEAGLFDEETLLGFLVTKGFWDEKKEEALLGLPKDIEKLKVGVFKLNLQSRECEVARSGLNAARDRLAELHRQRHAYDHLSQEGAAGQARARYLLGASLYWPDGGPVFTGETFWDCRSELLDSALHAFIEARLEEAEFRELARTDPWRGVWACKRSGGQLFETPVVDLTEEQRTLIAWSLLYDSVYEHPDCPQEEVLNDDDALDGFLIDQRLQRESARAQRAGESLLSNDKIRKAQEVFLVADTGKDARKISAFNDPVAEATRKQRLAAVRRFGVVHEADMPDTKQKLSMLRTKLEMAQGG